MCIVRQWAMNLQSFYNSLRIIDFHGDHLSKQQNSVAFLKVDFGENDFSDFVLDGCCMKTGCLPPEILQILIQLCDGHVLIII